jgi:hypothetical protein
MNKYLQNKIFNNLFYNQNQMQIKKINTINYMYF